MGQRGPVLERLDGRRGVVVVGLAVADHFSSDISTAPSAVGVAAHLAAHGAGFRAAVLLRLVSDVGFLVFLATRR